MIGKILALIVEIPLILLFLGQIIRDTKELRSWAKGEDENTEQ